MSTAEVRYRPEANESIREKIDEANGNGGGSVKSSRVRSAAALCYTFACCLKTLTSDCLQVRVSNAKKLITKEDPFHLHKLLGVSCLVHYAYRGLRVIRTGTTGLQQESYTPAYLALHAALHISSFAFNLPKSRAKGRPMIWPEMRWHTSIFAGRSIICALVLWWEPAFSPLFRGVVCLLTMKLADVATEHYKDSNNGTTIRDVPYPAYIPKSARQAHFLFYAFVQAAATSVMFSANTPDGPFFLLFVIQVTPFVMTLIRKSVLTGPAFHFYYTGAILLTGSFFDLLWDYSSLACFHPFGSGLFFLALRVGFRMNKYILWSLLIVACVFVQKQPMWRSLHQAQGTWRWSTPTDAHVMALAEQGDFLSLHALLGMHPTLVQARTHANITVLHYGVAYGRMRSLERCLSSGVPADGHNESLHAFTPLKYAVLLNRLSAVKLLLRRGANPYLVLLDLHKDADRYEKVSVAVLETLRKTIAKRHGSKSDMSETLIRIIGERKADAGSMNESLRKLDL